MDKAGLVFYPLQGFFNCMIFISFKVYNYKRFSPDSSICSILRLMFSSSAQDPACISRISIIKMNEEDQPTTSAAEDARYKVQVSDEKEDERHFRLGLLNISSNNNNNGSDIGSLHLNPEITSSPPNNTNPEMTLRLGLFHATVERLDNVEEVEDEEEASSSVVDKNQSNTTHDEKTMDHVSFVEMSYENSSSSNNNNINNSSGGSSSSDTYQFYPGVLKDSKAMKIQLGQQAKNFVSTLPTDCKSTSMEKEVNGDDKTL
jgi:hypothetical protein